MRVLLALILSIILIFPAAAEEGTRGTVDFQVMGISMGVRSSGMGEACVGMADDISSLSLNPAGLSGLNSPQLMASHYEWFGGIRYEWISFAQPIADLFTVAASISYLHAPPDVRTVESSAGAWGYAEDGTFSYSDTLFQVGLGTAPMMNVRLGTTFKLARSGLSFEGTSSSMPQYQRQGSSFSFGLIYETPLPDLRVGVCYRDVKFSAEGFSSKTAVIPTEIAFGASYQLKFKGRRRAVAEGGPPPENRLILACEADLPSSGANLFRLGAEYQMANGFSLRVGYRTDPDRSGLSRLSGGIGYRSGNYRIDYAFISYGDLGDAHRASLTLSF
ncbi:UPF0164 family protein [Candidatus Poribacteria bacterium]|nr:UPF0164 family protein [Candidatus Poribacteria bacterium]